MAGAVDRPWVPPIWLAWVALLILTGVRLWAAAATPLAPDEAYYWVWSRALAGGYPDHPPMVALWIRAGVWLAGDTPLGVRLLAPFAGLLGTLLLVQAGDDVLPGRRLGLAAGVLMNATLLFGVGSVTMTPDTPLLLFWTASVWALGRVLATGRPVWWLAAGLAAGLALDSKYTAALLLPGVVVWLLAVPGLRPWLGRPWPWLAAVIAGLVFAPVVAWNAGHGWVSFLKQGGRAGDWQPVRALQFLGELLGGQIGLATPGIALLLGAGIVLAVRRAIAREPGAREPGVREPGWTLLAVLTVLPGLVFLQHALGDRVQANWPSVMYPAASIAAAGLAGRWLRLWRPALVVGLVMTLAVWVQGVAAPIPLSMRFDPTLLRVGGWEALAAAVARQASQEDAAFLVADNYGIAAVLARLVPREMPVLADDSRWSLFDLPDGRTLITGRVGLLVRSARRADPPVSADWASLTRVGQVVRSRDGMAAEVFDLFRVVGRPGAEPVAVMPRPQ
jgi:4-amino-4-deoxy-L-arabinose transferase-like glycosyltransferase